MHPHPTSPPRLGFKNGPEPACEGVTSVRYPNLFRLRRKSGERLPAVDIGNLNACQTALPYIPTEMYTPVRAPAPRLAYHLSNS